MSSLRLLWGGRTGYTTTGTRRSTVPTSSLAPRRQRGSPFLQTASSRTFGRYVFSHSKQFLKMGQHGVTGWWPVIFAMLAVFCLCPEKVSFLPAQVIFNSTTIPVLSLFIYSTSPATLAALKAPFPHPDQPRAITSNPMPSKHTEQPFTAQSFGAGNLHIHPSDVPVINLPLLSKTRLSMETAPHQRGENLTQVRGTEYLLRTYKRANLCRQLGRTIVTYILQVSL